MKKARVAATISLGLAFLMGSSQAYSGIRSEIEVPQKSAPARGRSFAGAEVRVINCGATTPSKAKSEAQVIADMKKISSDRANATWGGPVADSRKNKKNSCSMESVE